MGIYDEQENRIQEGSIVCPLCKHIIPQGLHNYVDHMTEKHPQPGALLELPF